MVGYKRIAQQKREEDDSTCEEEVRKRAKGTDLQEITSNFEVEPTYNGPNWINEDPLMES